MTRSVLPSELASAFTSEVDGVTDTQWYELVRGFKDANIYQTSAYERARSGVSNTSHVVVKREGEVVAAAQARIMKVPAMPAGIAYVRWGPMWNKAEGAGSLEVFRQ